MRRIIMLVGASAICAGSQAQILFSGGSYSQGFDSLASSGTNIPWTDNVTLLGWHMRRVNDDGAGGTTVLADQYNAGDGASNAGAVYSFGTVASGERALGSIGSTSMEHGTYGMVLQNTSGNNILSFTLTYMGEQWRNGGNVTAQSLMFSYRVGNGTGSGIGDDTNNTSTETGYVPDPSYTRHAALDFTSLINTTTAGALDGNAAANRTLITQTVTLNATWVAGGNLWVRWVDPDSAGNDHGLGIDELRFDAAPVPEPATMAALLLGVGALAARRRNKK